MDLREFSIASSRRHPWELARADFFCELLARRVLDEEIDHIIDVGAGDAFFATRLAALVGPRTEIVCTDVHYDPAALAQVGLQLPANVRLSRELPERPADLIVLLDVLEHIEDDRGFLGKLVHEKLVPGGQVLISVPAWPALFARHDVVLAHHRRYTPDGARALLLDCDLAIRESGGLFHSLLPVRALQVLLERTLQTPEHRAGDVAGTAAATAVARWDGSERLTRLVQHGLKLDNALSRQLATRGWQVPGLTWWALCRSGD